MNRKCVVAGIAFIGIIAVLFWQGQANALEKKIILRYASQSSPSGVRSKDVQWWASQVEKRSNGAIKVKFFWSGSLLKAKDTMEGVGEGIASVGEAYGVYHPAKTPLWTVADTPFSHDDPYVGLKVMQEMFNSYKPMINELKKYHVKLLMPFVTGMTELGTSKKKVLVPDDIKGLKIRFAGGEWAKFWEACGAVPLTVSQAEVYEALMRGIVDGTQSYTFILQAYKQWDVLKHYTLINAGEVCSYGLVINLKQWESLSPELQKVLTNVSNEFTVKYAHDLTENNRRVLKEAKTKGVSVYQLTPAQRAKWEEKAKLLMDAWVASMDAKGLPGKQTQQEFLRLRDKYAREIKQKGYPWER